MRTSIRNAACTFIVLVLSAQVLYSQVKDSIALADANAQVPALSEFHSVIYPLWHTAWPDKNIKMLVELTPEIDKLTQAVVTATLPGILREKQAAWENGIKELLSVVKEYKAAVTPVDSQKLLQAAEDLHRQYEKLVRIIRPSLKELAAFHSVLYVVYHYYLPQWELEKIRSSVIGLREKMDLLNQAQLSKRQESKSAAFTAARSNLDTALRELEAAAHAGERKAITDKINSLHTKYQEIEEVFN
ncbi:MAG: hypothetical protein EHM64_00425 [Ignavibacteriae bacterium]|nr:MAG: hypothetical protein EHM64_00425 [Ignavibacteriota bacterium]